MNENSHLVTNVIQSTSNTKHKTLPLYYRFIKRGFDIFNSLLGLILLIPIMIIVKIIFVVLGDFDSIFYVQKRIGRSGKLFSLFKFRTMTLDADETLDQLLEKNTDLKKEYRMNKKLADDPRITVAGKLLRRFSIDELPQLINILLGDMSFVGNRPYLPREKEDMSVYYNSIISTKPGLTGYWQVSGRSDTSFDRRLELEKYYSEHCCLKMDIMIFLKTFGVVFFGNGAK